VKATPHIDHDGRVTITIEPETPLDVEIVETMGLRADMIEVIKSCWMGPGAWKFSDRPDGSVPQLHIGWKIIEAKR
jgi:hypothetical protein